MSEKLEPTIADTAVTTATATPPPSRTSTTRSRLHLEWIEFRKRYLTLRRVIFWTIWILSHTALFVYGWLRQGLDQRLAQTNTIGYSVSLSRGAGLCIAFDTALILLPMLRTIITTIYPKFTLLPLDENIWFHRQVAYSLLFFTVVHVTGFYVNFYRIEELGLRKEDAWTMLYQSWAGVTGWIMCLVMFLMYTTSTIEIRIMNFETFRYTHFLYWVFFIALLLHAAGCFVKYRPIASINPAEADIEDEGRVQCLGYNSWRYVIVGVILYATSTLYGTWRSFRRTSVVAVIAHPERVVEIRFTKPSMRYLSGQWLWLCIPTISRTQWHPFTITSCPSDTYISIHIRCVGDWTDSLAQVVGITESIQHIPTTTSTATALPGEIKIRVDGPFGAPAELVYRERAAMCVGSGIGITPWASVLKDIWSRLKNIDDKKVNLRRLDIIWVCRNIHQLQWFANLLVTIQEELKGMDPSFFHVHIYLTRAEHKDQVPPQLRNSTTIGRPSWDAIIGKARQEMEAGEYTTSEHVDRVGVYLCGGHALGKELAKTCRFYSNGKYSFPFKKEHF